MSRFNDNEEGIPWGLWESIVAGALSGRRGQAALAEIEEALLALPEPKLVASHLVTQDGEVCAIGAYAVLRHAKTEKISVPDAIAAYARATECSCGHPYYDHAAGGACSGLHWNGERPCDCEGFELEEESEFGTVDEGVNAGLTATLAWHFAWLNDEKWCGGSPEHRYQMILDYVRRAQGKETA